jgi:non-specific serine/threonine protein kinase
MANACPGLARQLLQSGPRVKLLASSRESLHVVGETTYPLSTLAVPGPKQELSVAALAQYEAMRLFSDRALAAQTVFQVNRANAAAVADICRRLDGIPLAIELAAARVRALSVETIAERLSDRFHLLTGGDAASLPRLQTLRACIDWSYDLLTAPERSLLGRLAVFSGGWTLQAAEAVGTGGEVDKREVLDLLTRLVEKSLVEFDAGGRYRLLETVRQYANERLVESRGSEIVRERHRDYFLALAEEAAPKLTGAEQAEWLQRLEDEHENLRAGLDWSLLEAGCGGGLRLCAALQQFWFTRGHLSEGREWCVRAVEKAPAGERTPERAKVLHVASLLAYFQGDYLAARAQSQESLAIRRQLSDRRGMAASLNILGAVAIDEGDFASARALHEESLAIVRQLGNRLGIANSLSNLGVVAYEQSDFVRARALYEESLAIERELGNSGGIATSLSDLGALAHKQGDYAAAGALRRESLMIRRELGDRRGMAYSLEGLAETSVTVLGSSRRAARILGAAERLREQIGTPLPPIELPQYDMKVASARAALGDDVAFDRAWQEGRALTLDEAIALALEETVERP